MISFNEIVEFAGPIVLYMSDKSGYGDVSLAVKITKFLVKKYPKASIYIIGHPSSFKKINEIIPDFLDSTRYPNLLFIKDKQQLHSTDNFFESVRLEIETAIYKSALDQSKSIIPHPKIFIGEYGVYEKSPYNSSVINMSGNIGNDYPGILIEDELLQFSQLTSKDKIKSQIEILKNMKDLHLKMQILEKNKSDMVEFIANNSFVFAYYHYPISYKRMAVIFAASNAKKHANLFVSASSDNNKNITVFNFLHDDYLIDVLKKIGYQKIVFYDKKSLKSVDHLVLDRTSREGREFRIIQRSRFSHDLTLNLMRLSDLCGVAGDQSLTEAISLGLIPIPEEWQHQFNIVDQIARTYYDQTVMAKIYNKTWRKQRRSDIHCWIEAGEMIREKKSEVATILTKIQEESNLYNTLEYRLNLEFSKPLQQK